MESTARAKRLEKQQKFLKTKGKDMLRCKLKTLDKLEEAEEKEKQEKEIQALAEQATMPSNLADDPFVGLKVPLLPPGVWDD